MDEIVNLSQLTLPEDLKQLNLTQKRALCREIRRLLIQTVSRCGGHLASNLGTVEMTVALHSVFESPADSIIWDVGHQAYAHKILTGRLNRFDTLRKAGGISGFPRPSESAHDAFVAGHSSTSISAACGIAAANRLQGKEQSVIAVIGDGALTGGLAYEGLNNAGKSVDPLIIVLNHNDMSISKNVGALARHLTAIRTKASYHRTKDIVKKTLDSTPLFGKKLLDLLHSTKTALKDMMYHSNMFEDMGFTYLGPVDGHDLEELTDVFVIAKALKRPVVVHTYTVKGKGYSHAEKNPGAYHGISKFDIRSGSPSAVNEDCFSTVFGRELTKLAGRDARICAITAAMKYGTGLDSFYHAYKERFFDVGIAEQHAVTFAAGLAAGGMLPVFAVYSTFLQRAYDQLLHDTAIEGYHVVLGVDRAGIVGEDGETHQGVFDVSFLSTIPGMTILSPSDYAGLEKALFAAFYEYSGPVAVRYPRGRELTEDIPGGAPVFEPLVYQKREGAQVLLVSYGRICANMDRAARRLAEEGIYVSTLRLIHIHPVLEKAVRIALEYKQILFFEEGMLTGGVARQLLCELAERGFRGHYHITAIQGGFIPHQSVDSALAAYRLDADSMTNTVKQEMRKWQTRSD